MVTGTDCELGLRGPAVDTTETEGALGCCGRSVTTTGAAGGAKNAVACTGGGLGCAESSAVCGLDRAGTLRFSGISTAIGYGCCTDRGGCCVGACAGAEGAGGANDTEPARGGGSDNDGDTSKGSGGSDGAADPSGGVDLAGAGRVTARGGRRADHRQRPDRTALTR